MWSTSVWAVEMLSLIEKSKHPTRFVDLVPMACVTYGVGSWKNDCMLCYAQTHSGCVSPIDGILSGCSQCSDMLWEVVQETSDRICHLVG